MRNLLNFLAKYNHLIIFLILEGIAIYLISNGNSYQNARIIKGIRGLTTGIEKKVSNTRTYFHLREISQSLARENAILRNTLERSVNRNDLSFSPLVDTIHQQQYSYSTAEVVSNSVNRQKNFFTLNKGREQGLSVDMAVTDGKNAAGVIVGCSENYSVVMSLLNLDFKLSARIKSNGYFGSLSWDGRDYSHAVLNEIPQHVTFGIGDTIETTGYSAVFPEGILVGTVSDFEKIGGDFYRIEVLLLTDFKKLHFVNAIGNLKKKEQIELEKLFL
ncbi:MAG: rod shape-determining protein MreC [Bacteroidales bacterium]|jgi:rod shape-determining protein MreC|nr:rod shape-determining protein MreC [Bacteroidales bacterium]